MKQILVTGGLGYIGAHTVVALINAGYEVIIVDNLSNSDNVVLEGIQAITSKKPKWYLVDLKDYVKLEQLFKWHCFLGVVHFAAHKAVGESVTEPLKYYKNNLLGLINLLECCEKYNVKNFIFSSSCTVYGQADEMPINENTPLKKPLSPYGKTKQMGETIIEDWIKATGFKGIVLRYFNPIGAHPTLHIGESIEGEPNNLLPSILNTALGKFQYVKVYGNDYPTKDGTAIRDYIDVNDLAEAHVKALNQLVETTTSSMMEYYNLGIGKGYSVLEMIQAFEKVVNIKIPYQFCGRRAGDIESAYADYTLAKSQLNWVPTTDLETSLQTAWQFQLKLHQKQSEE